MDRVSENITDTN